MKPLLHLVAAARPNLPKLAVLWAALELNPKLCEKKLLHTGQHYDPSMFRSHLEDLGLPDPAYALHVNGGSHAELTGRTMIACEALWREERPTAVLVVGDVDATLAATLAARKLGIKVVHLEAGLRCADLDMAEEINRRAVDAVADLLWPPSLRDAETLLREGHAPKRVVAVGSAMAACLLRNAPLARCRPLPSGLQAGRYGVLTLHRAENVDHPHTLTAWLHAFKGAAQLLPLAWPCHPRTAKRIAEFGLVPPAGVTLLPALGYLDFLGLLIHARLVASDSGGVQEEATVLDLPCLVLRNTAERAETLITGSSRLIRPDTMMAAVTDVLGGQWPRAVLPPLWDDRVGERMATSLASFLS